jgi:PhnB protein
MNPTMPEKKHVRQGFGTVRPYLYGQPEVLEFVKRTFGAQELERNVNKRGGFHAEVKIGDSVVVLEIGEHPPETATHSSVYVYVEDVDATYQTALECGATSIAAPEDMPYQERGAGVKDSFGNVWWVATYKAEKGT